MATFRATTLATPLLEAPFNRGYSISKVDLDTHFDFDRARCKCAWRVCRVPLAEERRMHKLLAIPGEAQDSCGSAIRRTSPSFAPSSSVMALAFSRSSLHRFESRLCARSL